MGFQSPDYYSPSNKEDLEGGRTPIATEDTELLHAFYSYLFGRGSRASWKLFACCTLVGLIDALSTLFILAEVTNLRFSDMVAHSNVLLLSTGLLISLTWCFYSSHHQWEKEQNQAGNELPSRVKLCVVGSFLTILLSPAIACLPLLGIFWFPGRGTFSSCTSGLPLTLSWAWINSVAIVPILYLAQRRKIHERCSSSEGYALLQEGIEDCDTHENLDETDGPTFLSQRPPLVYYDIFGGPLNEETKAASTFTSDISWKYTVDPSEVLHELSTPT